MRIYISYFIIICILYFVSCFLFLVSCGGIKTHVDEDPESNSTIYRLTGMYADIDRDFVGPYGHASFSIEMYVPNASYDTTFYLKTLILSPKRFTINYGDTMSLTIEGQETHLLCSLSLAPGNDDGFTMNHLDYYVSGGFYKIDRSVLNGMANSSIVGINIHTEAELITCKLRKSKLDAIRKFRGKYFP